MKHLSVNDQKDEQDNVTQMTNKKDPPMKKILLRFKTWLTDHKLLSIIIILFLALVVPVGITWSKLSALRSDINNIRIHARAIADNAKNQNLPAAKAELEAAQSALDSLQNTYHSLSFWRYSPLAWHYQDGQHVLDAGRSGLEAGSLLIAAIEPYIDVLGLTGSQPLVQGSGTAEDRITTIIETLPLIIPQLNEIQAKIGQVNASLEQIDPKRYPFSVNQTNVQEIISQAKHTIGQIDTTLTDYRPVIEQLPSVAGANDPKRYLILFQNDGELRATGGFITAYALINVDKAKVTPEHSDDIYELDQKFRSKIEPPAPITKYLNESIWNLRNMNLSPDFKISMDLFSSHYVTIPGEPDEIDGIISVDTQVLTHLIEVLGPVEVPGYGIFTAEIEPRCNCPQVVYALENMITRPTPYHRSDRKGILGPLMQNILLKAYDAPSEQNPALFQTLISDVAQKHILFYFLNQTDQLAAETINVAGRIQDYDGDYLHINDTNFSGAKSNMYVSQEVEQDITLNGDVVNKVVTIAYKNPQKADNCNLEAGLLCLNGVLRNWVRIYIPKGSELVDTLGLEEDSVLVSEDLDKTVIEGFFKLDPESQAKIQFTYTVPYHPQDEYKLLIQKQPGTKESEYIVKLNGDRSEFNLSSDQEIILPL